MMEFLSTQRRRPTATSQWKSIFTFCLQFSARSLFHSLWRFFFLPQIGCVPSHIHRHLSPPPLPSAKKLFIISCRHPRCSLSSLSHAPLELFTRSSRDALVGVLQLKRDEIETKWGVGGDLLKIHVVSSPYTEGCYRKRIGGKTHSPARMDCNFGSNECVLRPQQVNSSNRQERLRVHSAERCCYRRDSSNPAIQPCVPPTSCGHHNKTNLDYSFAWMMAKG